MARRNEKTARKAQGTCRACGKEIEPGQRYAYWDFRYRGTLKLHAGCPARRSWLTGSEILGTLWDIPLRAVPVTKPAPRGEGPWRLCCAWSAAVPRRQDNDG